MGRIIDWNRHSLRTLPRSAYESVIHRILERRPLRVGRETFQPLRMQGWYEVVFRNTRNGRRRVFNLDDLAQAYRERVPSEPL